MIVNGNDNGYYVLNRLACERGCLYFFLLIAKIAARRIINPEGLRKMLLRE